ncbi:hypothetical protein GCM10028778_20310 [Barrientosiimonas marina]|uniref:Endonuclease NucS domain-containing protein n=1 Tax=Lentibacillus kimchii TaxID=1542911 RepID=A0ABW2UVU5_9BACI
MTRGEEVIRDYLADNLNFIEEGLQLIDKEYYLPNNDGSRGYIDILATDSQSNFVIIELKRSVQASRQAIHEVIKYTALLKQKHKVKDSEIRIIIISTNWEELLTPFSKMISRTNYYVEGYDISIDDHFIPDSKTKVEPITPPLLRKFSAMHLGLYCKTDNTMKVLLAILSEKVQEIGIINFVFLEKEAMVDGKYPNPYCLYFTLLEESLERYWDIIDDLDCKNESHCRDVVNEYISQHEERTEEVERHYLEQEIITEIMNAITEIKDKELDYFVEGETPEGLANSLNFWRVIKVNRFGFIEGDIRLTDKQIIKEIVGFDGGNSDVFIDFYNTQQKAKYNEISQNISTTLAFNRKWEEDILRVLRNHQSDKDTRISLYIYDRNNVLESIYTAMYSENNTLPSYELVVDVSDVEYPCTYIYYGKLIWNRNMIKFENLINKHFASDSFNILLFERIS